MGLRGGPVPLLKSDRRIDGRVGRGTMFDFIMTDPYPAGDPRTNYSLQVVSQLIAVLRDPTEQTPVLLVS